MSRTSPRVNVSVEAIYTYARSPYGIYEQRLSEIRLLLDSVNKELNDHDDEISQLESQLLFLRAQQKRVQKKAMTLQSLLGPIYRLPNELLTRIFDDICENAVGPGIYELSKAPFDLSAVCSRWRSLCLSHSRMWSKFAVDCSEGAKLGTAVDLYLERSKQQPLALRLTHYNPAADNRDSGNILFKKLTDCCGRWRHVTLSLSFLSAEFPYLSRLDFPILESLDIHIEDNGHGSAQDLGIFARSPNLQTLEVWPGVTFIPNRDVLGRITKLTFGYENGRDLLEVLSLCSNLHTLITLDFNDETDISDLPIVIPTLTSLHVEGETGFKRTFHSLTTPALTKLQVDQFFRLDGNATRRHIERFLDRSGCSLTTLIIKVSWTDKTVVALLRRLPSLQELTILDRNYQQSHLPIVPKLHSLSLEGQSTGFDHKLFMEMISSRWIPDKGYAASIGVSCIRSVKLCLPPSQRVDEAEYLPLIRLRKMGLCFSLESLST
ncbi:hypothetical protein GYMLUDRAFT_645873 [Collybiopsis luxurians FD-317 M1]|nr:hypothetical protein GYMLUDRAFT_645873 [Collybiopsis luxurians FD-317 M1]